MLGRFYRYLKFLLRSTNQHGVHSPFVYNLVTKGVYQKLPADIKKQFKTHSSINKTPYKLLFKIIRYFNIQCVYSNNPNKVLRDFCQVFNIRLSKINISPEVTNQYLFLVDNIATRNYTIKNIVTNTPECILVVLNIHRTQAGLDKWHALLCSNLDIISISFYNFGLIFNKPTQAKQHFIIRT